MEQEDIQKGEIYTSCKGCIFSNWELDENGKPEQLGCEIHKVNQHKAAGAEIVEAYDDEESFYIINKRFCSFYRPPSWEFSKHQTPIKKVYDEVRMKYQVKVLVRPQDSLKDLEKTLISVKQQDIPAEHIAVIATIDQFDYFLLLKTINRHFNGKSWKLHLMDKEATDYERIDEANRQKKVPYYMVVFAGYDLAAWPSMVNQYLMDCNIFSIISHEKDNYDYHSYLNCQVVPQTMHSIQGGQAPNGLYAKLLEANVKYIKGIWEVPTSI